MIDEHALSVCERIQCWCSRVGPRVCGGGSRQRNGSVGIPRRLVLVAGEAGAGYSAATTLLPWEITFGSRGVGCAELGGGRGSFSAAADAGWARS